MSGRLGNCTIGKRRGNESPVKRLYASQTLSSRSLIINMPHRVVCTWDLCGNAAAGGYRGEGKTGASWC